MAIKDRISTAQAGGEYMDMRDFKITPDGAKIRLFGEQEMGFSYYQHSKKDDGSDGAKIIRSKNVPEMTDPTDGYKGTKQKPAVNLYSVVWNYETEAPALLSIDKVSVFEKILAVEDSKNYGEMTDYDFVISFDGAAKPADKYKVEKLDKSDLTESQIEALKEFAERVDLGAYVTGGSAFVKGAEEKTEADKQMDNLTDTPEEAKEDGEKAPF